MDDVDNANEFFQEAHDKSIALIRAQAADIPKGMAGECFQCGEESLRLVKGACAPCRDKYNLV